MLNPSMFDLKSINLTTPYKLPKYLLSPPPPIIMTIPVVNLMFELHVHVTCTSMYLSILSIAWTDMAFIIWIRHMPHQSTWFLYHIVYVRSKFGVTAGWYKNIFFCFYMYSIHYYKCMANVIKLKRTY